MRIDMNSRKRSTNPKQAKRSSRSASPALKIAVAKKRASKKTGKSDNKSKNTVNSVFKAFSVLRAFSLDRPAMTISEVSAVTHIDRGTVFRLLHTLLSLGYLEQADARRFRLGLKCLELGFTVLSSQELWFHAAPLLQECVPTLVDAASLGVLDGPDVVYLQRFDRGLRRQNVDRRPGSRVSAYGAALGHVLLAWLPEQKQVEVLESAERIKLSERTLTTLDSLLKRLRIVRSKGYAISDGENAYGLRTVAVPVFSENNQIVAGISLTVDSERMSIEEVVKTALPRAREIAGGLSRIIRLTGGAIKVGDGK